MDTDENHPTNKPNESHANSLQNSTRATPQEIMVEIARLEIHCPVFSPMTPESRREWIVTLCQDLAHKSLVELQYGARRYRTDPENKWFPTPGAWLGACKSPLEDKPRRYAPLEDLPPPMKAEEAQKLIERVAKKYNYKRPGEMDMEKLKEDILARPPIPYIPMTTERRAELLSHLKQALTFSYDEETAANFIAELPE